jgi:tetratricopeptide (TPR) repeat protein
MSMLLLTAWALAAQPSPTSVTHDLWRAYAGGDKVYVEVGLPDGGTGLFLVDTGAAVSVLNNGVADRLGLEGSDDGGRVAGLSGSVPWHRAVLPSVDFGAGFVVRDVEVAVGVPGVPQTVGAIPVDGILGHNVWSNFVLVVDYPADRLELHRPGTYRARGKGQRVRVAANRVLVDVGITAVRGEQQLSAAVAIEVDTGAAETSLWCQTGEPFRAITSLGLEPVVGIGAALDRVPDFQFLTETRHIPATTLRIAGRTLKRVGAVRWSNPDDPAADVCAVSRGLVGFRPLGDWRVVLDYPGEKLVLEPPRQRRVFDAAGAWLAADAARDPLGTLQPGVRAKVLVQHGEEAEARALVQRALQDHGARPDLAVLASRIDRYDGQDEAAIGRLTGLSPVELVDEGAWGELIGGLVALGREREAVARAEAALALAVDDPQVRQELLVGYSDALLAAGRPEEAGAALDEAIAVDRGGSGFLFRRAMVSLEAGDRYGAITTLRNLLDLYPIGGQAMWLYAAALEPRDRVTFRADVERAVGRLHPGAEPLDFVGASLRSLGDTEGAAATLASGHARDCKPFRRGATRDNCDAWYWALGGERLDEADRSIRRAVRLEPKNSAFRDTAAVVAAARGEYARASEEARQAARLSPDDPYLIWQARRYARLAGGGS